ncbi:MAG TPA: NADP oxidoreductase, partial [Gemmatimonadales bacterium]|nr:NADP oxidoreductase [Gemmatimonadales bacterium]
VEHLQRQRPGISIDLFDRLPTPFGLVRGGVAPDHQKIKAVTRVYEKLAAQPGFRFFGNVEIGKDLSRAELRQHYHAVIYASGAQSDRHLGIPGEDLAGSHPATEFVAWYNGHPEYRDRHFDLSQSAVAVIGMGNVAVDVVRILARTEAELARTDIAPYALEALAQSRVRDIYMIGRRGPVQAAFTNPEVKELGEMAGADTIVLPGELELDPVSAELAAAGDHTIERNLHTLNAMAGHAPAGKAKRIHIRFLLSPTALEGSGRVERLRLARNRLVPVGDHELKAEPSGETETIQAGLVFRSVGYKGLGIPDVPLDGRRGIIPNADGRVLENGAPSPGEYVVGWIKRGPSGVIGTNKPDAAETVDRLLADADAGSLPAPVTAPVEELLGRRGVRVVSWSDWRILDEIEKKEGAALGRPRVKFTRVEDMLAALAPSVTPTRA